LQTSRDHRQTILGTIFLALGSSRQYESYKVAADAASSPGNHFVRSMIHSMRRRNGMASDRYLTYIRTVVSVSE
jgi:hypothetical protein